ncbi:TM2 domain-containing protein [Actinomyces faecalis]|uniref:TM2 domain-containing protein n=1 Tax=Actinomyces faecalis TaxID=2722820 RepID=UPI0015564AE4|nr:TM2 domain-containing protein [Actinomyces faecalis]
MAQTPYPQNSAQPYVQPQQGYPQPYGQQPYNPSAKSKTVAALLAFFLGWTGAHSFYRGQTKRGVGHLVLTVLTVILFIAGVVTVASNADAYAQMADGYGQITDAEAAKVGGTMLVAYLLSTVNGLWAFVEFIMILVSKDGSLR